ncbi:YlmH/Sll1252 family protein [Lacticaseibacillus parahuelsenbergensis]|uniref:YlmH/Sll1252 family protein n=1 Tax=Lacticaseibacillus parahuelsenbergensis TaxID=3068305 RepID=A0ABY9L5Y4_9LACO|nr:MULTISPECIES: YlmH/Sll1252 family protein [Lacticaseibacillus]MDE3282258.1 YlmH/Sll1252 family protein [Lacticaseibacillus casei]WLV79146.1 YlmH/Sll1252 family protein [Lacticaseibacillus sp. NCIMB 15471]
MDAIYQHFRKDEAALIDHFAELVETARTEYRAVLTDFTDPRQRLIADSLISAHDDMKLTHFGGYPHAERQRLIFAPDYYEAQPDDFDIRLLQIVYPEKFAEMHHSTIQGTLLNAGLDRDVFGDIITDGQTWQFFVAAHMEDWVMSNITKIGRVGVHFTDYPLDQAVTPENDWEPIDFSISALRLDTVVAHGFNMSRQRAKVLIQGGKVRLNFGETEAPDAEVATSDIISVRGFGRLRLDAILGETKKGKLRVSAAVIHK